MGRWKPPRPASSAYITPEGYKTLKAELKALWQRRTGVVAALAAAAAEGDRSENAEYIYRKKELGGIDYRIRYLQKRLPQLAVVQGRPESAQVYFGAWARLEHEDGSEQEYRLVGPDEADPGMSRISVDSPLARALLKARVGDEIHFKTGDRAETLRITAIRYE